MPKLVFRSASNGDYNTLYLDGRPFHGWRPDDDPFTLIEKTWNGWSVRSRSWARPDGRGV